MKINRKIASGAFAVAGVTAIALAPYVVNAAEDATSTLTQQITAGNLSTSILDANGDEVASPSFAMSAATVSNEQQSVNGTFGTNSQRITVDNPQAAETWTLSLNVAEPGTSEWTSGSDSYAYNDSAPNGRLTVDPSTGTITVLIGDSTGISLGSSASFSGTSPITLMSADNTSSPVWNGYVTGITLTQTIPAGQPAGSYTLDMVQTVTAS
jgi:hypothetical protein